MSLVLTAPLTTPVVTAEPPALGSPMLWGISILVVLALVALDFLLTRRPHEVSVKEAAGWSVFYIALPLAFGAWIWSTYGSQRGVEFLSGYIVEKSLSVDNLFVFMLLLAAFAVPPALQQRVLLFGIVGALVLRGVFIALGAAALQRFSITFLVFGAILLLTAVKVWRDAKGHHQPDVSQMRSIRVIRRFFPVTEDYRGTAMTVRLAQDGSVVESGTRNGGTDKASGGKGSGRRRGRLALTPLAVATAAVLATDVVFAVDSVPAVYGITDEPYLVFATNAFALLGLRALYFLLADLLSRLVHLSYGLAVILAFIGAKLVLHWAHMIWPSVPDVPTPLSLAVIVGILVVVTVSSLVVTRNRDGGAGPGATGGSPDGGTSSSGVAVEARHG